MAPAAVPIALALSAGSAVAGIINATNANRLQNESSDFNSQIDLQKATLALQQSAEDERRMRVSNSQQLGDMRAGYGASGVTTEGSPMEALRQSASNAELDALTVRNQGAVAAWNYQNQSKADAFPGYASQSMLPGQIAGSLFGAAAPVATAYALKRT